MLSGIAAVALLVLAVAITFRLNMGVIRSGWPVMLWRITMFGAFLTLVLVAITPLVHRRPFVIVVAGPIGALGVMAFVLAIGTASASVAGLVLTLPAVIVCLAIAGVCTALFHNQVSRYE